MNHAAPEHHISKMPTMIRQILHDMNTCITEQENIILEERDAMKVFNATALTELVERRARTQSILDELESRCQRLMGLSNTQHTMEYLIDAYADDEADMLQNLRIELMRRMQTLEKDHIENHLRLRAAWNVTTSILQHIGAVDVPQTYQKNYATQQASR
jgi:Mg2+ and Co2+ transporter CorA